MPPSPSLRRSPGIETRGDSHRRGRSHEFRLTFEAKDDDLTLFKEIQSKESDNFLLQPTYDFEDLLTSKPKVFPDLLNSDGDKNDYDWLLTPPETPLFPSLDDEETPAKRVHTGRDRTRPISVSRSSTMERNHRRGSPSPRRFSSGSRGTSPVRTTRRSSISPQRMTWQSSIQYLSSEVLPNLRTSLADRPGSYVRGSSPASKANSWSKLGRRSMSPGASRSIGSGDDGGSHGTKTLAFSKKPIKSLSGISSPKRSFDSATRQMERKTPQSMFRPLLSSVPSSNLYTGTATSAHRKMISRHSSVTTSSNTEGSEYYQDDMASDCTITHNAIATCIQDDKPNDFVENIVVCSKCDSRFHPTEISETEDDVCPECKITEEKYEKRPDSYVDIAAECLFKRSSSAISYDDLSYSRDFTSSTLSSTDLRSTRHGDMHMQMKRRLSWRRSDTSSNTQSTLTSLSGSSIQVDRPRLHEEHYEVSEEIPRPPSSYVLVVENEKTGVHEDPDLCEVDVADNVKESSFLESYFVAEESRETRVDVRCSLSTMSEIEINDSHPSSPRSQTDLVSKEESGDRLTRVHPEKDVRSLPTVDFDETETRSLTLEEATDAILFCNSIIHDLAYKAASIAIAKEKENLEPFEVPRPRITVPERREDDFRENTTGTTVVTRKRRKETEQKPPLNENGIRSDEPVVRNVGIHSNANNMKPLKFESKCNCTIM